MTFQHTFALALAIVVSMTVPTGSLMAQDKKAIPGDTFFPGDALSPRIELHAFPGDTFSPRQLRQFKGQGIVTAGDLVSADPMLVGRILDLDPKQARNMQQKLRANMR
jgi:hypothetical protein